MGQSHYTVYVEIFTMKKVSAILPCALIGENCIENMVTFTALMATKFFCNTKVAGIGEMSAQQNFPHIW